MMEKETSTRRSLLRALYLLPLVCISLALNAQTKVNYVYTDGKSGSGQLKYDNGKSSSAQLNYGKNVSTNIVFDEIKMDGESLEGMTLDDISRMLPDVKKDDDGNLTTQGHQIKRILINGNVLYDKEASANAAPTTPKISVFDSGEDMNMEFTGYTEQSVDNLIKSLPGVEYDKDGNVTVNGKAVRKILVNGKEYVSNDPDHIYANEIVDEVEGKTPEGHNRVVHVNIDDKTNQVSITSQDNKAE